MAFYLIILVFVLCYLCIAVEHTIHVSKTATALLLCAALWTIVTVSGASAFAPGIFETLGADYHDGVKAALLHHLGDTAEIVFFLLGAMTIVEIVDQYGGFKIITDRIKTTSKVRLLWTLGLITFFMSAVLDNLTTTIVMLALLRKLTTEKSNTWFFASMVVIAANAGGAWTPIGDVTTIMLWIAGKVSAVNIMKTTFLPSLVSVVVPFLILTFTMKGHIKPAEKAFDDNSPAASISPRIRNFMFCLGVGCLLGVPVFKTITHLPPYVGMLGALSIVWIATEIICTCEKDNEWRLHLRASKILRRVDMPSVLFFLGILMAVGALQFCGHLDMMSASLDQISLEEPSKYYLIDIIIGTLSSVVDNVPLVAGTMGMYTFPEDHYFWELLAYCAGTGGSMLIIGSAAGVAAMGIEKIDFIWYVKHITWLAFIGYICGALVYILQYSAIH